MCILDGTTALDSNSSIQSKKALFLLYNSLGYYYIFDGPETWEEGTSDNTIGQKNSFFFLVDFQKNFLLTQAVQIGPKFTKKGTFS